MIEVVKQENYSEAEKFNSNRELIDNGSVRPRSDQERMVSDHGYSRRPGQ